MRLEDLARSFPCLAAADGVSPLDLDTLADWARRPLPVTAAQACAVRFVCHVHDGEGLALTRRRRHEGGVYTWTLESKRGLAPFDLHEAITCWKSGDLAAFQAWAAAPWYGA